MADDPFAATDKALSAKTGKGLDHWVGVARSAGIAGHMALVGHLKDVHGLGHGHANSVVHAANASAAIAMDGGNLLEAMFAGPRAELRPVYDAIRAIMDGFGTDIEYAPKKGYVSLRRSKQFAIAQPSTATRFDLGLNLKGVEPAGRLEAAGSWNAMCSHRVRIAGTAEVDGELAAWLKAAYDRA
jgi:Domain of unknown function (DUF5655)/Domain of unknown function (DUF4287)